jgi:[ribosomal protein S5]-alanine N-acetyltransferase
MSLVPVLDTLETDRLVLRRRRVDEAGIYRQLWTERDPRVPPHRRISPEGRPTEEDIAAQIRAANEESKQGILAVERKSTAEVIGYRGLIFMGMDLLTSLSWPTSCSARLTAAASQPRQA